MQLKKKILGLLLLALPTMYAATIKAQTDKAETYLNTECNHWTQEQKMYGLSKLWMEAKRNFIYMDRVGQARWDSLYQTLIPQALATKNDWTYFQLMNRFCCFLNDGHTYLTLNRNIQFTTTCFSDGWGLELCLVDGKVLVNGIDETHVVSVPLYSEVTEVDGMPVTEALAKKAEECFGSTPQVRLHQAAVMLLAAPFFTQYRVTFRTPKGKRVEASFCNDGDAVIRFVRNNGLSFPRFAFRWYPGDVAYLRIGTFMRGQGVEEGLRQAFPEMLKRAKKLIIDIRQNSGGNSSFACDIFSHFTSDSIIIDGKWRTRTYNAAYASWGSDVQPNDTVGDAWRKACYENSLDIAKTPFNVSLSQSNPQGLRLIVPTLILTDYATNSSCENFLVAADGQKHIRRMGEVTSGSTGNPIRINLIEELSCSICTKEDVFPDGRVFVGVGIKPDYEVHQSVADFSRSYDTVLAAALRHFGSKMDK